MIPEKPLLSWKDKLRVKLLQAKFIGIEDFAQFPSNKSQNNVSDSPSPNSQSAVISAEMQQPGGKTSATSNINKSLQVIPVDSC